MWIALWMTKPARFTPYSMLEKVLETARFPYAVVSVNSSVAGSTAQQIPVAVTLHVGV